MNVVDSTGSALIILARSPRYGQVKSRLAATLGDAAAGESYRLMAERLFGQCAHLDTSVATYIFYEGENGGAAMRSWAGAHFHYVPQASGGFGQRLLAAFETVFGEGARKAVIVGTDVPDLSATIITQALRLLDKYPAVIGPDHGGGYYLLGLRMIYPDLFLGNLRWGTHFVYSQTLRLMDNLGIQPAFLPRLIDVDVEGDLRQWLAEQQSEPPLAVYARQLMGRRAAQ
jgi:uncharacterized protein